jgi:hypothetical protein
MSRSSPERGEAMMEMDRQEIPVALYDRLSTKSQAEEGSTPEKDICTSSGSI